MKRALTRKARVLEKKLLVAAFGVTATVSHFVAVKFMTEIAVLIPVGMFSALGRWAMVAAMHVEVVIYLAVEVVRAVEPRSGSDEDPA